MKKWIVEAAIKWLMKDALTLQEVESLGFRLGCGLSDVLKQRAAFAEQSIETMLRGYRDALNRGFDKGVST